MFDAAVGQQALQVALHDHQERGGEQRQAAEGQQQSVTEVAADGVRGDGVQAQQGVHGAVQQHRREQGADGRRRFGVRVRQPTVHGHKTDLGAVAHGHKNESQFQQVARGSHAGSRGHQRRPVERHLGRNAAADRRQIKRDGSEQREGNSHGADDQVFPAGFDRALGVVKAHQQRRGERGRLDGDPQHSQIRRQVGRHHGEQEQEHQRVKPARRGEAALGNVAQIPTE